MPSFLYGELSQRMSKVLEPRYESLVFENGSLIPTETDLVAGAREVVYERFSEFGDADLMSDGGTNIPIVDISLDEDRYSVFMVGAGFPVSFQEERAYNSGISNRGVLQRSEIDRFERRMSANRKVIAMRQNRFIAFGRSGLGMAGFMANSTVTISAPTAGVGAQTGTALNVATYQGLCDFFVDYIESVTDNFVSEVPSTALVSSAINRRLGVQNANGTKSVRQFLAEEYPGLEFKKIRESGNTMLAANGVLTAAGATMPPSTDRIVLYPKFDRVVHRHIESDVAQLLPEDYIRVDGMRKIYTMYSCFTPAIIDYPQDVRYIDVKVA